MKVDKTGVRRQRFYRQAAAGGNLVETSKERRQHDPIIRSPGAGVKVPRGFAISPDGGWLVAAGQDSDSLASHKIDPATGKLTPAGKVDGVGAPVCVVFAGPTAAR